MNLDYIFKSDSFKGLLRHLANSKHLRKPIMRYIEKKEWELLVENDPDNRPPQVQRDKYDYMIAMLHSVTRGLDNGLISRHIQDRWMETFIDGVLTHTERQEQRAERVGYKPPGFLVISPTKTCNLRCKGCYACSNASADERLSYEILDRVMTEKEELWGSYFTVISGGEPFMYRDDGKDLIDLAADHPRDFFMVYTNGTLIDKETAKRIHEVGNITPAISVEGFEKETDERRGKGVHKKIRRAFENLREVGVPFGISATALRNNWDIITSDEFADYYFMQLGALYGWIFQYMPIGRAHTLDMMVTPEQRLQMLERTWNWLQEKRLFVADFWNSGPASTGCISAGRSDGYLYLTWSGHVTPCAFVPYAAANINEVYAKGGNLNSILHKDFFRRIRRWQDEYGYAQPPHNVRNLFCPCPIRDHHDEFMNELRQSRFRPIDSEAEKALHDENYHRGLAEYGRRFQNMTCGLWNEHYDAEYEISGPSQKDYRSRPGWVWENAEEKIDIPIAK